MNLFLKHGLLTLVSLIILTSTILILSDPVQNREMLSRASFGYPYAFLSQDLSRMGGFLYFPGHYEFSFDFNSYPLSGFSVFHFIADFLIIFGIIEVTVFVLEKCKEIFLRYRNKAVSEYN